MAEGILRALDSKFEVYSAGTKAEQRVNPYAVRVMAELGIDISQQVPKPVSKFLTTSFDYVITVCDGAREICPVFTGEVKKRLHIGFEDPADAQGTEEEKMRVYREVRDGILEQFTKFYKSIQ